MTRDLSSRPNEQKQWEQFYYQTLTRDGQESLIDENGTKQLILLPMLTYTLFSTMLQKLKYLPDECFNRITIGGTPIAGLRPIDLSSSTLMTKLTEVLRSLVDGVRKQQILNITMIFYQKNNINLVYDSYSIAFDYSLKLPENQSNTSIQTIAHLIHQIEYMFNWNDAFPDDVELTFVVSVLDQFDNDKRKIPSPFIVLKQVMKKVYNEHETSHLLGRLTTPDGKIWLKFLPNDRALSGSTIRSEDLPTKANLFKNRPVEPEANKKAKKSRFTTQSTSSIDDSPIEYSPKLKKKTKRSTLSINSNDNRSNLPSLTTTIVPKTKKRGGLLSTIKSLITPSRPPAPLTSSTPNLGDLVLIRHTSTPKPGETASRITIGNNNGSVPLSAIQEASSQGERSIIHGDSPTLSTFTATDLSTAQTPMLSVNPRAVVRAPTVRGQAALARKKIAAMQIRDGSDSNDEDDEDEDDNDQFNKLFNRRKSKKPKTPTIVLLKTTTDLSEISSISSSSSNFEFLFTPPTARKRPTTDRTDIDDLTIEHGTPPKTPRTARRNRVVDETASTQRTPMDIGDVQVTVDSPRLLRSITKRLQQQATTKTQLEYEKGCNLEGQSILRDPSHQVYVNLERSSVGLHYSMDESD